MKKYIKPRLEIVALESKDIITASSVIDNGQATYEDKNGNVFTGQKGTFVSLFESIW